MFWRSKNLTSGAALAALVSTRERTAGVHAGGCPHWSQSTTSYPSEMGTSVFQIISSVTILTVGRGIRRASCSRTRLVYTEPAASWSGRMITSLPARGDQSDLKGDSGPRADVLATRSGSALKASAAFSPSTTKTRLAELICGK